MWNLCTPARSDLDIFIASQYFNFRINIESV
jgi:hypothetical protein